MSTKKSPRKQLLQRRKRLLRLKNSENCSQSFLKKSKRSTSLTYLSSLPSHLHFKSLTRRNKFKLKVLSNSSSESPSKSKMQCLQLTWVRSRPRETLWELTLRKLPCDALPSKLSSEERRRTNRLPGITCMVEDTLTQVSTNLKTEK